MVKSSNPVVRNALAACGAAVADNMSAQQAVTLVEMEIGREDSDAENLLAQYGRLIRAELGERAYRDLYERASRNERRR